MSEVIFHAKITSGGPVVCRIAKCGENISNHGGRGVTVLVLRLEDFHFFSTAVLTLNFDLDLAEVISVA